MGLNGHREAAFTYQECVALMDEAGADRALILPPLWGATAPTSPPRRARRTRTGSA